MNHSFRRAIVARVGVGIYPWNRLERKSTMPRLERIKRISIAAARRIRTRSFRLWSLRRNDARDNLWLGSNHLEHRRKHCQLLPSWLPDCLSIGVKPYRPCQRTFLRPWGNTSLLSKDIRYVYLTAIRFRFSIGNGYERVIIEMILARWTIFEFIGFHTDSMIWNQLKL